jgi:hypothetical protein
LLKFTKLAGEMTTPLDLWLYFLRHGEGLNTDALPAALAAVAEVRRAMGESQMIAQSDVERERYEARLKLQRDISSGLAAARDEGLEQGRKEGQVGQIHLCQGLLGRDQTPAEQLLALPLPDLEHLVQQLKAELTRSPSPPS